MGSYSTRILCAVLITGLLFCAGCMSSQVNESPVTTAPQVPALEAPVPAAVTGIPAATLPAAPPVPEPAGQAPAVTVPAETSVSVTPTWIPKTYGKDAMNDPRISLLTFYKECMVFDIPDCGMRHAFPQAAVDPAYGTRQPVPKLLMLTEEEIEAFIDKYEDKRGYYPDNERHIDPNAIGSPECAGLIANPKWNFIRINITLMPRNARPGEYDIGINIRSRGSVIEQLQLNRSFVLDQPVILVRYIPLKVEEMEDFESIDLVFSRRE